MNMDYVSPTKSKKLEISLIFFLTKKSNVYDPDKIFKLGYRPMYM